MLSNKPDIAEYISQYVILSRKGGKLWGCCPFHQEKEPSFTVSMEKQVFHCFGCKAGGDVVQFVKQYHDTDFNGALNILGIRKPETKREKRRVAREIAIQKKRRAEHLEQQRIKEDRARSDIARIVQLDRLIMIIKDIQRECTEMEDIESISGSIHKLPLYEYERDCLLWNQPFQI